MKVTVYKMKCLTNMHVGNGEVNYSVVDNEVQKDPYLKVPNINASGVKGALREHSVRVGIEKETIEIEKVFGDAIKPGGYKFFSATLLARPLRVSLGSISFANATSLEVIKYHLNLYKDMGVKVLGDYKITTLEEGLKEMKVEGYYKSDENIEEVEGQEIDSKISKPISDWLEKILGKHFVIIPHEELVRWDLPVIARNVLEEGISKNLWYEEIVPHQSVFFFAVGHPEDLKTIDFSKYSPIQFGGNASIGYGLTKIEKVGEING